MKSFKDLNITTRTVFVGKSIEIEELLGREIIISDYKIEPSKFPDKGNGKRLVLQIQHEGSERVVFTGSVILQDDIKQVDRDNDLPFKTTIIKLKPKGFKFT